MIYPVESFIHLLNNWGQIFIYHSPNDLKHQKVNHAHPLKYLPMTASVLFRNILFCFSWDVLVRVEELDCDEVPVTNVFSLSVSDVILPLESLGVGGFDTE